MNHIKVFVSVILLTISFLVQSQDEIKKSYYEALKTLNRMEEIAGLENVKNYNYSFLYEGDFYNYGHYSTPEETKNYSVKGYSQFYNNLRAENEEVLSASQKTYSRKSIIDSDSVIFIDFGESLIEKDLAHKFRYINLFSPIQIIELINRNKKSLHLLEKSPKKKVIGFNDSNGDKYYLEIDSSYLISSISKLAYDDTHGDILEVIEFANYETLNEYKLPKTIIVRNGSRLIKSLECSSFKLYPKDSTLSKALDYPMPKSITAKFEVLKISKDIFLCRMLDLNNKVLIYIKGDEISVFEAPGNLNSGRNLIEAIKEEFPTKKIKNCFISHHHPDHAGSVIAFMEIGAAIVTTEDNKRYFQSLASEKHSIGVSRELVIPDGINFETVSKNSSKKFLKNKVSVHEIGDFTAHSNEHLIFYFPKEKILFVGDLIRFPDERIIQQGKRAFSIYEASKKFDLEINSVYTSWPLHGHKDFGTWDDLLTSLKSRYPELN